MLTHLKVENFKRWKKLDVDFSHITLLYGTNSSGKTSILQALRLLKQSYSSFGQIEKIEFGGNQTDYVDFGSYRDIVRDHQVRRHIGMCIEWDGEFMLPEPKIINVTLDEEGSNINFGDLKLLKGTVVRCVKWRTQEDDIVGTVSYNVIRENEGIFESEPFKVVENGDNVENRLSIAERAKNIYLSIFVSSIYRTFMNSIYYIGPLRHPPQRNYPWTGGIPDTLEGTGRRAIDAIISDIRNAKKARGTLLQQVENWLIKLGLVSEFSVDPLDRQQRFYEARVKVDREMPLTSLADVGFGISQVLPVVTALFYVPEGSIVLIEQPELHLHPSAQAALADLFLEVAEKRKLQLIIESHSEHLLTRFQRRIAEPQHEFATPQNVKAYFCKPGENGSTIEEVRVNRFGQIENYPPNFFGDLSGDLDAMFDAGTQRRLEELEQGE